MASPSAIGVRRPPHSDTIHDATGGAWYRHPVQQRNDTRSPSALAVTTSPSSDRLSESVSHTSSFRPSALRSSSETRAGACFVPAWARFGICAPLIDEGHRRSVKQLPLLPPPRRGPRNRGDPAGRRSKGGECHLHASCERDASGRPYRAVLGLPVRHTLVSRNGKQPVFFQRFGAKGC